MTLIFHFKFFGERKTEKNVLHLTKGVFTTTKELAARNAACQQTIMHLALKM